MKILGNFLLLGLLFVCLGCVKKNAALGNLGANGADQVNMRVEVISFKRNSGHYSLPNGGGYLFHHSILYVHEPEKYRGMQLKVRHQSDREPAEVWTIEGGSFEVSLPERFVRDWKVENYEFYANAFKVLTDQRQEIAASSSSLESKEIEKSIISLRLVVESYKENAEKFYYANGTFVTNHITVLRIESPEQYKGRFMIITHPNDYGVPGKIWRSVGASFEARVHKSDLEDQETRIDWRALKMVTEKR